MFNKVFIFIIVLFFSCNNKSYEELKEKLTNKPWKFLSFRDNDLLPVKDISLFYQFGNKNEFINFKSNNRYYYYDLEYSNGELYGRDSSTWELRDSVLNVDLSCFGFIKNSNLYQYKIITITDTYLELKNIGSKDNMNHYIFINGPRIKFIDMFKNQYK